MGSGVLVLENTIQNYAWGSHTAIAELLGRPTPAPKPEAELWIGAHPKAPSHVVEPCGLGTLDALIAHDPVAILGRDVCERFGGELPFLFKVLAAAEPLSIQAHPDEGQARRGWERENAEGVPIDAPQRNYRDPSHKPELVCALVPFVALKGFRAHEEIARRLEPIAGSELSADLARLERARDPLALGALFARLLTLPPREREPLLSRAAAMAERHAGELEWQWVARLARLHPGDAGALAPLYLNLVVLAPGEALFLPARELHAYLDGTALELMASSDNVLRGGVTAKHVDVPELLATLVFEPRPLDIVRAQPSGPGERTYRTPAREFELALLDVTPGQPYRPPAGRGVEILLGLAGEILIDAGATPRLLRRGQTVLVPASLQTYELSGAGQVARARVPVPRSR